MASRETIMQRLELRRQALAAANAAYLALLSGQVQSYTIGSRSLTRFDLPSLWDMIKGLENEIDDLEAALLNGGKRRKAVGAVPRDW